MSKGDQYPLRGQNDLSSPTTAELLVEQYKLLEERRKYFGSQFMQTIGGVLAIFSVVVGLLGGNTANYRLLQTALLFGGTAFLLLAYLAYRLGQRQDDCEQVMREIESSLQSMGYRVAEAPRGAKHGARTVIVMALACSGFGLIILGVIGLLHAAPGAK
jgi:hypothetical protein